MVIQAGARRARAARALSIALPFVLVVIGAVPIYRSPWPAIVHLMLTGAHVRVASSVQTTVLPLIGLVCWALAIGLSLRIKGRD